MSRLVLILGKTGTGKSSSLRNFKDGEISVISCSGKEMPFRASFKTKSTSNYAEIYQLINTAPTPVVVIDDLSYAMSFDEMARQNQVGFQKFGQMATSLFNVFKTIMDKPGDQIFYLMAHVADTEDGHLQFKTTGKMLSDKIVLEGLTNIVLQSDVVDGQFVFRVQTDGSGVKAPLGMFAVPTTENDLKAIDKQIREFYKPIAVKKDK